MGILHSLERLFLGGQGGLRLTKDARDLFVELLESMKALAEERLGKRTLRTVLLS